ncbi:hypothetical protein Vadar_013314 [Vaccinium darrowii]|uniref:Uncharacterized protein n=1 Tax=Vaccinium darrowii TaxID=229202 RepID=A0ACB7X0Q2_9ERIC|nr:hypothetical protein Vadar_013314 [Vaccinium darrowii]
MAMVGPKRVPWFGSPFFADIWDPFEIGLPDLNWEGVDDDNRADVDWRETDKAHFFHADLPGVKKEDVKVQVEDGNILQISGERQRKEKDDTDDKWHRAERQSGSFSRRFQLPENSKLDEIMCRLENGLLSVMVPKKETEESRKNARNVEVA